MGADRRAAADRYEDQYVEGDAHEFEGHSAPRNRRLWLVAAIVALAVVGTAGAYGFRTMRAGGVTPPTTVPVIRADSAPKKIASAASNGDKQAQERTNATSERLVSREEQPLAIQDPNARPLVPEQASPISTPTVVPSDPFETRLPAAPSGASGEPRKIKTVTIRPEGEPSDAAPARPPAPAATQPSTRTQTATAPAPTRNEKGFFVQLSAQKSQEDAAASFRALQAKYPSVLSGRQPFIRRKEKAGQGIIFGAQVGPFASREQAAQLCDELKSAGGTCFVEHN